MAGLSWWPFKRRAEDRASSVLVNSEGFTGAVLAAVTQGASAAQGIIGTRYSLAFAAAEISPDTPVLSALSPQVLAMVGQQLATAGNSVWLIQTDGGQVRLLPAASWDLRGGLAEPDWLYRLDLFGPGGNTTTTVQSAGVLHARINALPGSPWQGRSFLATAPATDTVLRCVDAFLTGQLSNGHGRVLVMPARPSSLTKQDDQGTTPAVLELKTQVSKTLQGMTGQTAVGRSFASLTKGASQDRPSDWHAINFGPQLSPEIEALRKSVELSLLAVAGLPLALFDSRSSAGASREGYRQWGHATLNPLGRVVAGEVRAKLEPSAQLAFRGIWSADIQARGRALKAITDAGVDLAQARQLAGLEV